MEILNDIGRIEEKDKSGMLKVVEQFPEQCSDAVSLTEALDINSSSVADISSIAILGMGGSGIGGDLLRTVLEGHSAIPLQVIKGYELPNYVSKDTLIFAVSYSGNTEETISVFSQALSRGSKIIAVTSGGHLEKLARENDIRIIKIPSGYQPRAALGYLFFPLLAVVNRLGIIDFLEKDFDETLEVLKNLRERLSLNRETSENSAKQLATNLYGKIPVVYGSDGITAPAALRWKCQFNENSKVQAFWNVFPELNHNEIVGWELLRDFTQKFSLIVLRDEREHPQIAKRIEITKELISNHLDSVHELWCEGKSKLANILSVLYQGDFVSVYLALLNEVDPTPVVRIESLKKKLAEK